jgi:hypothetical protein
MYVIQNMAYDLTDDAGNPQQRLDLVNRALVLLGDLGISAFRGAGVYLVSRDGWAQVISEPIRPMYREYVLAGLIPGGATVHRGHYCQPFLVPDDTGGEHIWYDTLVCRLDGAQPARLVRRLRARRGRRTQGAPAVDALGRPVRRVPRLRPTGRFERPGTEGVRCFEPVG